MQSSIGPIDYHHLHLCHIKNNEKGKKENLVSRTTSCNERWISSHSKTKIENQNQEPLNYALTPNLVVIRCRGDGGYVSSTEQAVRVWALYLGTQKCLWLFCFEPSDNIRSRSNKSRSKNKPRTHKTPTPNSLVGLHNADRLNQSICCRRQKRPTCVLTSHYLLRITLPPPHTQVLPI